ncbi:T9SS C-terminal target domain-containing protein [Flagellimonas sp. DF-77]|uniref:T9SS C-terminal target domain-containing protein n=1 Tax=Flagellimonas algarum TaxID=3230298 RepID=UPI00339165E3
MRTVLFVFCALFGAWSFSQSDIRVLGELPESLVESSGLLFYNGNLITHNDSGGEARLYELDTTSLAVVRTVSLSNQGNIDWEDLAQDDDYIYIGDFGNNNGSRRDLAILRIAKTDYNASDTVAAERIEFAYGDQLDFSGSENSDFDAEALIVLGDDLIVLTKQWQQLGTVAYRIPKTPGTFVAERIGAFPINGLVTAATFDAASNTLYLLGYSQLLVPFFATFTDVTSNALFDGQFTKTDLNIVPAQMEALALIGPRFYATSEAFVNAPIIDTAARLFSFGLDGMDGEGPQPGPEPEVPQESLVVFKTFGATQLGYVLNTDKAIIAMGIYDASGRLVRYVPLEAITDNDIDISDLQQSLYYLAFLLPDGILSAPFFRD